MTLNQPLISSTGTSSTSINTPFIHHQTILKHFSTFEFILSSICLSGIQFAWTVELAFGTPYLLSLGLPTYLTAMVWLAGPLAGLVIQPLIGVYSDNSTHRLGRRRPFMMSIFT